MRAILVALCVIALGVGSWLGYRRAIASEPRTPSVGSLPADPRTAPATGSAAVIDVVDVDRLDRLISAHAGRSVLDFHAEWCKPCKDLSPRLTELAAEHPEIQVISIDVTAAEALSKRYGAEALPLLVLIDGGKETARIDRAPSDAELREWLGLPAAR
ncbi:MAG: thioredoxin family protein [Planctomycetes bacterium]|nr:thioredoxin family protein [Planctomycetota bacterium]